MVPGYPGTEFTFTCPQPRQQQQQHQQQPHPNVNLIQKYVLILLADLCEKSVEGTTSLTPIVNTTLISCAKMG